MLLFVRERYIQKGDSLMDGPSDPHDILKVSGEKALASYLVDEVQEVYRLQGVTINDKHIELIVRQMLRKVEILDPGDTSYLVGEQVDRYKTEETNSKITGEGGRVATFKPLLLGITKMSLNTESWISAASFQETTRILTEASVQSRSDYLLGLKENVIMGRLIPSGTGYKDYRNRSIAYEEELDNTDVQLLGGEEQGVTVSEKKSSTEEDSRFRV